MDKIEINNTLGDDASDDFIRGVVEKTLDWLRKKDVIESDFELSVALVNEQEIAKLNKQYRKKEKSTDVLSFCYEDNEDKTVGEIILCPVVIEKNAKDDRIEKEVEFEKNIIHGILHIVGFEHGEEMFFLQDKILGKSRRL